MRFRFVRLTTNVAYLCEMLRYYNTPIRLVVVLREVCNAVISKAVAYLSGDTIFGMIDMHRQQAVKDTIQKTIEICGQLRSTFFEYVGGETALGKPRTHRSCQGMHGSRGYC